MVAVSSLVPIFDAYASRGSAWPFVARAPICPLRAGIGVRQAILTRLRYISERFLGVLGFGFRLLGFEF